MSDYSDAKKAAAEKALSSDVQMTMTPGKPAKYMIGTPEEPVTDPPEAAVDAAYTKGGATAAKPRSSATPSPHGGSLADMGHQAYLSGIAQFLKDNGVEPGMMAPAGGTPSFDAFRYHAAAIEQYGQEKAAELMAAAEKYALQKEPVESMGIKPKPTEQK